MSLYCRKRLDPQPSDLIVPQHLDVRQHVLPWRAVTLSLFAEVCHRMTEDRILAGGKRPWPGGRYQIDTVDKPAVRQLNVAISVAPRAVQQLNTESKALTARGSRGKLRRRGHSNDPPYIGARGPQNNHQSRRAIGKRNSLGSDLDAPRGQSAKLLQLVQRVGERAHGVAAVIVTERRRQDRAGLSRVSHENAGSALTRRPTQSRTHGGGKVGRSHNGRIWNAKGARRLPPLGLRRQTLRGTQCDVSYGPKS